MTETTGRPLEWVAVVPVKLLAKAKTRLAVPGGLPARLRERLALAMTLDTVAAALGCPSVRVVVTVTDDPVAAPMLAAAGAHVIPDTPDAGLNPALEHGVRTAAALAPDAGIAVISSDLPALGSADLAGVLALAAAHDCAVVADAAGSGTTLLTARPGVVLPIAFGADSLRRHVAAGAVALDLAPAHPVRRDVDTWQDLQAAQLLGLGEHTVALLAALPTDAADPLR